MNKRLLFIIGLILIAAVSRLIDEFPPNFAPLGAMALFGAAMFRNKKLAFIFPVLAFFISDLLVNNILYADYYTGFVLISPGYMWTYGAILLIVVAGLFMLKKITFSRVIGGSFAASLIFFIVSNLGVWASSTMYPMTLEGLITCYVMAIPFFHMTVLGDLFFCGALFGAYELAKQYIPGLDLKSASN